MATRNYQMLTKSDLTLICKISIGYLALPFLLFLFFWFKWFFSTLFIATFFYALSPILLNNGISEKHKPKTEINYAAIFFLFFVSVVFSVISFPAYDSINFWDALKHKLILADLAKENWPVVYLENESGLSALRYSFAYYLVPAGISKIIGLEWINYALILWCAGGVSLFFLMAIGSAKNVCSACLSVIIAGLFSGLSAVISLAIDGGADPNVWNTIFNAWARSWGNRWLIGSHPFELAWSAQHALPAWLGAGILYYCHNEQWFKKVAGVVAAVLLLWSPFIAFSYVIILGLLWLASNALAFRSDVGKFLKESFFGSFTTRNIAAAILVGLLTYFITTDSQKIPFYLFTIGEKPLAAFLSQYIIFIFIEFGALLLAVKHTSIPFDKLVISAVLLLFILPFSNVGVGSDLQMRGSQLPFTLLMFFSLSSLRWPASPRGSKVFLSTVIFVGLVGGYQEIGRKKLSFDIGRDNSKSELALPFSSFGLYDAEIKPQYLANISRSSILDLLFSRNYKVYAIEPVSIDLDRRFSSFGDAEFNERERVVKSQEFTDAALVSDDITLPIGTYKIDAILDWDVTAEDLSINAAHLSLHGVKILVPIKASREMNKRVAAYFHSEGSPIRISFGLGGWAKGKGFVKLKELQISSVTKSVLNNI